uniref:VWFD domain-containing protein n=1 Tax=Meloidogyne hapla TaxID=6305 RepID=A0A1I8BDV3_MELHA
MSSFHSSFLFNNEKFTSEQGCVMRDICGADGELRQNCRYEGRPVPISLNVEKEYKDLCPQLFKG